MDTLYSVVTVKEAALLNCVSERTMRYHVDKGNVISRKTGNVILIDLASLKRLHLRLYRKPLNISPRYVQTELQKRYA